MLAIIREAISLLPQLRADPQQWSRCAYREITHPEYGKQDANELERHRFLIALHYEHVPDDEFLVRNLFAQGVIARRVIFKDSEKRCGWMAPSTPHGHVQIDGPLCLL